MRKTLPILLFLLFFLSWTFVAFAQTSFTSVISTPWILKGENNASEKYASIDRNILKNKTHLQLTYNLHGMCLLGGDASAIIFDQPVDRDWHYISLSAYGKNCYNGSQTVRIPLSDFEGLDTTARVGKFHVRFWHYKPFVVDIASVALIGASVPSTTASAPTSPISPTGFNTSTISVTPTSDSFTGYKAEYFTNRYLQGVPTITRNENQINFAWNSDSPDPRIPKDEFSARFTKKIAISAGTYRFRVIADDGVRLFVDGKKIIDQWKDQPSTTYASGISLSSGNHTVVMEYYEHFGGAVAQMSYVKTASQESSVSTPTTSITPTQAQSLIPVLTSSTKQTWSIQSTSSMKETKDRICGQRDAAWIAQWVAKAKELGVNYIAIETPYDNPGCASALEYTKRWVSAIRSAGLKVWHRHMPLAFEGIYDIAKTNSIDFLPMIAQYIKTNPTLFAQNDIFTPIPEPQNGGISGITWCYAGVCQFRDAPHFNQWLRSAIDISAQAFSSIGLSGKVKIGYFGFDGFIVWGGNNPDWSGILEDATVQKMGNITIDHYPELVNTTMKDDLDKLQKKYPNTQIIIGEWGTVTNTTDFVQQVKNSMSTAVRSNIIGFNYWHMGMSGNEALINDDFSKKIHFDSVQSFFKPFN